MPCSQGTRSRTVLVAGATGMLGREVVALLHADGYRVKTLSRDPVRAQALAGLADEVVLGDATDPATLVGAMDGVDAVVSCLGAPMAFVASDRRSFSKVDTVANLNLLRAAKQAEVRRFVYVSLLMRPSWEQTEYARAHEAVVQGLRESGISHAVVRPTGMFPIFDPFVPMARRGVVCIPGSGQARTNPVHPREVAHACVAALEQTGNLSVPRGWPGDPHPGGHRPTRLRGGGQEAPHRASPAMVADRLCVPASPSAPSSRRGHRLHCPRPDG